MLSRLLPLSFLGLSLGAEEPLPGHSHQGHAFNEGPRQEAVVMEGTGEVRLEITTDSDKGQVLFDQGLGQLHGFWYFEAERSFRQLAAEDPSCAMAYWGMAMANWENPKRAKGFIEKAKEFAAGASDHERLYIDAQANFLDDEPKELGKRRAELLTDLEDLIHEFPEDIEAKALLACRLWQFSRKGIPISSHEAVDALLQQVFAKSPMHPAHHYRIHLWDKHKAERALDSAAKLGFTAPAIAHMWHMPGHIYSKLHRYRDAAWHQQASARIDHAHMLEQHLLPDQIHNYAHNNEWLSRNWVHLGNAPAALAVAKSLLANPRHPKLNSMQGKAHSYRFGYQRLLEILEKFEMWEEALELLGSPEFEVIDSIEMDGRRLRLMGLASYHLDDRKGIVGARAGIDGLVEDRELARQQAEEKARLEMEGKDEEAVEKAVKKAGRESGKEIATLNKLGLELDGCLKTLDGNRKEALKALKESQRPKWALALEYLKLDENERADQLSAQAVKDGPGETLPLAARIRVLLWLERSDELIEVFDQLRRISSQLDLEARPFARLGSIAKALAYPKDWRCDEEIAEDFGDRPDAEQFGPLDWSPPEAPAFSLPDQSGLPVSLEDYLGKPFILIHYLGHRCLHCAEQLNAIGDRYADFKQAGLPVLAVSTDTMLELAQSQANYKSEGLSFPFPLVADPTKGSFRDYGAHDDFEDEALHGTYLIDSKGRILWVDVAADPFMDIDFLLTESRRLLDLHDR